MKIDKETLYAIEFMRTEITLKLMFILHDYVDNLPVFTAIQRTKLKDSVRCISDEGARMIFESFANICNTFGDDDEI